MIWTLKPSISATSGESKHSDISDSEPVGNGQLEVPQLWGATDTGRDRETNEDAFLLGASWPYFAVADGMGGQEAGELASAIAVKTVERHLASAESADEDRCVMLVDICHMAHAEILRAAQTDPTKTGMGCTLVVGCVVGSRLSIAHVGDGRAYVLSQGCLRRLTEDQSVVGIMVRDKLLTEDEARHHPRKNEVLQALGMPTQLSPASSISTLQPGDRVLLCSDGLWEALPEGQIEEVLGGDGTARQIAIQLIGRANHEGGHDNITVVVYQHSDETQKTREEVRARQQEISRTREDR